MVCTKEYRLPELLAPAGSFEHLTAAIHAGADAVYLGGEMFGARAFADNFSREELIRAIYYAHFYEKKVYLTVNTLMKENELRNQLCAFLLPFYQAGLDGVIVQDMGTASFIRENFPELPIHASTQMTITGVDGVLAARRMGMSRVVLARELSLTEIRDIKEKTGMEMEVFIHGALCYCYSGQCLLSSVYGNRSGNRGKCAQPCRLPYEFYEENGKKRQVKGEHLLSPKDICSLDSLPELISAGVDSLKIEGRMKNPEYVAGVTAIYRKYLDYYERLKCKKDYCVEKRDRNILEELFSRNGFSGGYFHQHNGKDMMSTVNPNHLGRKIGKILNIRKNKITFISDTTLHARDILVIPLDNRQKDEIILTVPNELDGVTAGNKVTMNVSGKKELRQGMPIYRRKNTLLSGKISEKIIKKEMKRPVRAKLTAAVDEETKLTLESGGQKIVVKGEAAQPALTKGISKEDVLKQLRKTGNVPFNLEEAQVELGEQIFLPLSVLKKLRQEGYTLLEEKIKYQKCRNIITEAKNDISRDVILLNNNLPSIEKCDIITPKLILTVYNMEMLAFCEERFDSDGYCLPLDFWKEDEVKEAGFYMQNTQNSNKKPLYLSLPKIIRGENISGFSRVLNMADGFYVHNINEAELLARLCEDSGQKKEKMLILGSSLYEWNSCAQNELTSLYKDYFTNVISEYPMELSLSELSLEKKRGELLLYGHYPVMVSAQCLNQTTKGCTKKPGLFWLGDRKGRKLPVTTHCEGCYNLIWSDEPGNLFAAEEVTKTNCPGRVRIDFFHMRMEQIPEIMKQFNLWKQKTFY